MDRAKKACFRARYKSLYSGKKKWLCSWLYSGKVVVVVLGHSGCVQSGCIWAKVLVLGQSGSTRAKVVVFRQMWLYSGKVVVFGEKWL